MSRIGSKILLFLCISCAIVTAISAQQDFRNQRTKFTVLNIGFNGLASGLGAVINKEEDERLGKVFLRGLSRGALGGAVIDLGMNTTNLIATEQRLWLTWPSRLLTATGSSMTLNASLNQPVFENLHFNLWLVRFDYQPKKKKLKARIFTSGLYGALFVARDGHLNLGKSLETGIIYFEGDTFRTLSDQGGAVGAVTSIGMGNGFTGQSFYDAYAHELVHLAQFERFVWFNGYTQKLDGRLKVKYNWYMKLSHYIYFDLNGPAFWLAANAQAGKLHNCRFLEQEAENYGAKRFYGCN